MSTTVASDSTLYHRNVNIEGISIHVVQGGSRNNPAVLFLHGWPQNWAAFEKIMIGLTSDAHVIAIDLPGIGGSETPMSSNDKKSLTRCVSGVISTLELQAVTLVGHDIGGQIVYAYLKTYPGELRQAVIMNVAVPGVDPWSEVKRSPNIWHFAFHAVPELPERLVQGKEATYFAFFYDAIAAKPGAISECARKTYVQAYSRPAALHTGFEWYRAFPQDEKDNIATRTGAIGCPVLYLRGEHERGELEDYVKGLQESGLRNLRGRVIPGSGHFAPDEQPNEVTKVLQEFIARSDDKRLSPATF